MKTGRSVQFKNVDDILSAYQSRKVSPFAIFQDKQFLFKYEGNDIEEGAAELLTMCNALRQSAAIYTLAVYEDLPGGKLKSDTPYDGSFNFRFQDNFEPYNNTPQMFEKLNQNIAEMNKKYELLLLEKENEVDEPDENTLDKIAGFLSHPLVQQLTPAILGALGVKEKQLAGIAGIGEATKRGVDMGNEISEALYNAICKMMIADPQAEEHLIKLGNLAEKDPNKFRGLLPYLKFL